MNVPTYNVCSLCFKEGSKYCSGCKAVKYCSRECQKSDRDAHKKTCGETRILKSKAEWILKTEGINRRYLYYIYLYGVVEDKVALHVTMSEEDGNTTITILNVDTRESRSEFKTINTPLVVTVAYDTSRLVQCYNKQTLRDAFKKSPVNVSKGITISVLTSNMCKDFGSGEVSHTYDIVE